MTRYASLAAVVVSVTLAACGSSPSSSSPSASATHTASAKKTAGPGAAASKGPKGVAIKGYAFHPGTITVAPGTEITFTNHDQTAHTATSTAKVFDTGTLAPGASRAVVVSRPGTYTYYCQFHAFMRGTVVVR